MSGADDDKDKAPGADGGDAKPGHGFNTSDMKSKLGGMWGKVSSAAKEAVQATREFSGEQLKQAVDFSSEKVREAVHNMNDAIPYVDRAGFEVTEVELVMSVPPGMIAHLGIRPEIPEGEKERLLEEVAEMPFVRNLLRRLFQVRELQKNARFIGMGFAEIEVLVSLVPQVNLKYKKYGPHMTGKQKTAIAGPAAPAAGA